MACVRQQLADGIKRKTAEAPAAAAKARAVYDAFDKSKFPKLLRMTLELSAALIKLRDAHKAFHDAPVIRANRSNTRGRQALYAEIQEATFEVCELLPSAARQGVCPKGFQRHWAFSVVM